MSERNALVDGFQDALDPRETSDSVRYWQQFPPKDTVGLHRMNFLTGQKVLPPFGAREYGVSCRLQSDSYDHRTAKLQAADTKARLTIAMNPSPALFGGNSTRNPILARSWRSRLTHNNQEPGLRSQLLRNQLLGSQLRSKRRDLPRTLMGETNLRPRDLEIFLIC